MNYWDKMYVGVPQDAMTLLRGYIKSNYISLDAQFRVTQQGYSFLHIRRIPLTHSDMSYLPSFHIVASPSPHDKAKVFIRLMTHHGKFLAEECVLLNTNQALHSELLDRLHTDDFRPCAGVDISSVQQSSSVSLLDLLLVEQFDDSIIYRSRSCRFVVRPSPSCLPARRYIHSCDICGSFQPSVDPSTSNELTARIISNNMVENSHLLVKVETESHRKYNNGTIAYLSSSTEYGMNNKTYNGYFEEYSQVTNKPKEQLPGFIPPLEGSGAATSPAKRRDKKIPGGILKEPKACPKCGKKYQFEYSFLKHTRRCVDGVLESLPKRQRSIMFETVMDGDQKTQVAWPGGRCPICLSYFHRKGAYERHLKLHSERHGSGLEASVECPLCRSVVANKMRLNEHFATSHGPNQACCAECLTVMSTEELPLHFIRKHHYTDKRHQCSNCDKAFQFPSDLRYHIQEVHSETLQVSSICNACDKCGKAMLSRKALARHMRTAHSKGGKEFQCSVCEKMFYENYRLQKHLRIHTGLKPFKCRHCDYRTHRKDNVMLHARKVHKVQGGSNDVEKLDGDFNIQEFM